ncbi:hypothetical protein EYF80_024015 [Liparis tanakae]|uniref:Uncharacterized protein n=1 Tax=Liparis tanakae TaxID=230148 RepID=A0A4Z2HLQ7_9TELE|nr:hypothetical protein EYF80_024015 [Liparis tanakae]
MDRLIWVVECKTPASSKPTDESHLAREHFKSSSELAGETLSSCQDERSCQATSFGLRGRTVSQPGDGWVAGWVDERVDAVLGGREHKTTEHDSRKRRLMVYSWCRKIQKYQMFCWSFQPHLMASIGTGKRCLRVRRSPLLTAVLSGAPADPAEPVAVLCQRLRQGEPLTPRPHDPCP